MKVELWETGRVRRRLRWLRALGIGLIVGSLMAATGRVCYRLAQWHGNAAAARALLEQSDDDQRRTDAMIGAFNDATATIDQLRKIAREETATGRRARTLLRYLHERTR